MQRVMVKLIDGESKMLRSRNLRELDQALRQDGFHLVEAEAWGPPGGYQLFYRNGNVFSRVKTMGDKLGPSVNKPHAPFSLHDGESLQWTSDIAKFNNQGGISAKNVVSLEDWTAKNIGKPGAGNQWYVVKEGHTRAVGDVWVNSKHFNALAAFKLDGLNEIFGGLKVQIYHEFPKRP